MEYNKFSKPDAYKNINSSVIKEVKKPDFFDSFIKSFKNLFDYKFY